MGQSWQWFKDLPARLAEGLIVEVLKPLFAPSAAASAAVYYSVPDKWYIWASLAALSACAGLVLLVSFVLAKRSRQRDLQVLEGRVDMMLAQQERRKARISVSVSADMNSVTDLNITLRSGRVTVEISEQDPVSFGKRIEGKRPRQPKALTSEKQSRKQPTKVI